MVAQSPNATTVASARPEVVKRRVVTGPKKYFWATVLRSFKMFMQYPFFKFSIDNIFPETNGKFLAEIYILVWGEKRYAKDR
jgi:hypothetical protein